MLGSFNIPCVDHLREGVDYRIVDWDFATQQPAAPAPSHTPGTPCEEGEKMVFGVCRKVKQGGTDKDWESGKDTKQETELRGAAEKAGSTAQTNKAFEAGGKKYGWAIKNGKPVVVEWGSVAGTKPKAGASAAAPSAPGGTAPAGGAAPASAGPTPGTPGRKQQTTLPRAGQVSA